MVEAGAVAGGGAAAAVCPSAVSDACSQHQEASPTRSRVRKLSAKVAPLAPGISSNSGDGWSLPQVHAAAKKIRQSKPPLGSVTAQTASDRS